MWVGQQSSSKEKLWYHHRFNINLGREMQKTKENGKEFIDPMCSAFKKDYASLILYTSAKMKLHI